MTDELLIASKKNEKMKFKIVNRTKNQYSPKKYEKIITNKDFNLLAFLFYDLHSMGYPVEKGFVKFKRLINEPELFFL